ncbi:MAG: hypothetical protein JF599_02360 [Verrucomicrobia bacterium]|nr:hypothetical protein [Verrucomicrobiota bacterium]
MMINSTLSALQRRKIRRGVFLTQFLWVIFPVPFFAYYLYDNSFGRDGHISGPINLFFAIFLTGVFVLGVSALIICVLRSKCIKCGWMLLRNPKGMGPANFRAHPSCVKLPGRNAWGYQIMRAAKEKKIMCLQCGEDYDISK